MSGETEPDDRTLAPDDAFATLGDDTRMAILQALGEAGGGPLSFTELHDAVDVRDSGRFNYHLDQLVGHFVTKASDGYELRRAGGRVIEAVLSGAVTDDPVLERTEIDHACHYCGAPLEMRFRQESTATYCTECAGAFRSVEAIESAESAEEGFMGYLHLPPAGLADRSPTEVHEVAFAWQLSETLLAANGVCPRCSGPVEEDVTVCEDHEADGGVCGACGNRHAVMYSAACTNCIYSMAGPFVNKLLGSTALLDALTADGLNPAAPDPERMGEITLDYDEAVLEVEPFRARFTFETADGPVRLEVDDELAVVDVVTGPSG